MEPKNQCFYCKSEMNPDATHCANCGKLKQDIKKVKDRLTRNLIAAGVCFGIYFFMTWGTSNGYYKAEKLNDWLDTVNVWSWAGVIFVVIGLYNYNKNNG